MGQQQKRRVVLAQPKLAPSAARMAVWIVGCATAACGRSDAVIAIDCNGLVLPPYCPAPQTPVSTTGWPDFVQQLHLPACPTPSFPPLVVDTTEIVSNPATTLEAAGETLAFNEAIAVAAARGGINTITFAATTFPMNHPGVIRFTGPSEYVAALTDVCVDARERGVEVVFEDLANSCGNWGNCALDFRGNTTGSLAVGLTFIIRAPGSIIADKTQFAGCRFLVAADGYATAVMVGNDAGTSVTIGPGNVITGSYAGIWSYGLASLSIFGNYFGFDPSTRTLLDSGNWVVRLNHGSAELFDNVFALGGMGAGFVFTDARAAATVIDVHDNYFGVLPGGESLGGDLIGPTIGVLAAVGNDGPVQVTFGPGNVVRGATYMGVGYRCEHQQIRVTGNSISGSGLAGIYSDLGAPAPVIKEVSGLTAIGTCANDGNVELFSDTEDEGATYLGSTPCVAGSWQAELNLPSGKNLTATFTPAVLGCTSGFSVPVALP